MKQTNTAYGFIMLLMNRKDLKNMYRENSFKYLDLHCGCNDYCEEEYQNSTLFHYNLNIVAEIYLQMVKNK